MARSYGLKNLPLPKDLKVPSNPIAADWIAEAKRLSCGQIIEDDDKGSILLQIADEIEDEGYQELEDILVCGDLEDMPYISSKEAESSDAWLESTHYDWFGSSRLLSLDECYVQEFLICGAIAIHGKIKELFLFFHPPFSRSLEREVVSILADAVDFSDQFGGTSLTCYFWENVKYRMIDSDIRADIDVDDNAGAARS